MSIEAFALKIELEIEQHWMEEGKRLTAA